MDYSCLIYQRKYSSKKWWEECAWPLSWWTNLGELLLLTYWVQRDYQRMGPFSDLDFLFHLGSQGVICLFLPLCQQLECVAMRRKNMEGAFLEGLEAIWHEIFQILPVGLNISMPFHSSFLISSLLPLISPLISSTHLFFLKETTTSPPLQGFLLCGCFQWEVHRFWSLFWVQILIHHL